MRWTLALAFSLLAAAVASAEGPLGAFPPDQEPLLPLEQPIPAEEMSIAVYPVADLVLTAGPQDFGHGPTKIEASPTPGPIASKSPHVPSPLESMAELSVILQSVVAPSSWEMAGGAGHVSVHGPTQSLIVRQSAAGHQAIHELLSSLRRCCDVEVCLTIQLLTPNRSEDSDAGQARLNSALGEYSGPMSAEDLDQRLDELNQPEIARWTRRTQFASGGSVTVMEWLHCVAAATADRRAVFVDLHIDPTGIEDEPPPAAGLGRYRIPDGQTVIVPWDSPDGELKLFLVTARLLIPDEEEELLPTPIASTAETEVESEVHLLPPQLTKAAKFDAPDELRPVVYPVSDLITPLVAHLPAEKVDWSRELDQFGIMLARNTGPQSWRSGETITPHDSTRSLVIRQSSRVHEQIAEFLGKLRASQLEVARDVAESEFGIAAEVESEAEAVQAIVPASFEARPETSSPLVACVYPVADLVTDAASRTPADKINWQFELDRFAAVVARCMGTKVWEEGPTISSHSDTLSLVVRQTAAGHQRLADFLHHLRRGSDFTTRITVRQLHGNNRRKLPLSGVINELDKQALLDSQAPGGEVETLSLHGNGLAGNQRFRGRLQLTAVPSIDNSLVLLEAIGQHDQLAQARIPVGSSCVLRFQDESEQSALLITVDEVRTAAEEAPLLAIPALK